MKRALFMADGQPFESVMSALGTNAEVNGGSGRVALVVERLMREEAEGSSETADE